MRGPGRGPVRRRLEVHEHLARRHGAGREAGDEPARPGARGHDEGIGRHRRRSDSRTVASSGSRSRTRASGTMTRLARRGAGPARPRCDRRAARRPSPNGTRPRPLRRSGAESGPPGARAAATPPSGPWPAARTPRPRPSACRQRRARGFPSRRNAARRGPPRAGPRPRTPPPPCACSRGRLRTDTGSADAGRTRPREGWERGPDRRRSRRGPGGTRAHAVERPMMPAPTTVTFKGRAARGPAAPRPGPRARRPRT